MKIEVGTKFKIKATPSPHKNKTFTCVDIKDDGGFAYKCIDQNGDEFFFNQINFDYYGAGVIIISRPKYDKSLLKTAVQQTYQNAVLFGETAAPQLKAILKAWDVIERNSSIKFDGERLEFVSDYSGKTYIVTSDNCSTNCPAAEARMACYHRSIFSILTKYYEATFSNVREFPKPVEREYQMAA